jgi:hypothetical protein
MDSFMCFVFISVALVEHFANVWQQMARFGKESAVPARHVNLVIGLVEPNISHAGATRLA